MNSNRDSNCKSPVQRLSRKGSWTWMLSLWEG